VAVVDIIILGIILISCFLGILRGLVKEALSLAFWIGAAILASVFSEALAPRLAGFIDTPVLRQITAFVLIFIFTVFAGGLISNLISKLMSKAGLGGVDRALGALFGIIRGVVIVTVIVALTARLEVTRQVYGESILTPYVMVLADFSLGLFGVEAPQSPVADPASGAAPEAQIPAVLIPAVQNPAVQKGVQADNLSRFLR
jgi:membrane protein required for colicin V production